MASVGSGRQALSKYESGAEILLNILRNISARKNTDPVRRRKSVNLLLSALVVCDPTDEAKKMFSEPNLKSSVIKAGKLDPNARAVALEVLKKFSPGKCQLYMLAAFVYRLSIFASSAFGTHELGSVRRILS